MPKFNVRVSERVIYDVAVEAETMEAARAIVQAKLDGDESDLYESDLDMYEVDSAGFTLDDE